MQGDAEIYVKKDAYVKSDGNVQTTVGGNFKLDVAGTCDINSDGNMTLNAPRIDFN